MIQHFKYILILLLMVLVGCHTTNKPKELTTPYDSIYIAADITWHKQHYSLLDKNVFSIDLLTDGLSFDSMYNISGTGLNLYISDIFLPLTDSLLHLGTYRLDTIASSFTILPYKHFEGGRITGCYMLDIQESTIHRIIGFTSGEMLVNILNEGDIRLDFKLYQSDSTCYRASYQGSALYR